MALHELHCKEVSSGKARLNPDQIQQYLSELGQGWEVENYHLKKHFKFVDFASALEFANKVGEIAEEEGHHPDILIGWGRVIIHLTTHDAGGLTLNDFIIAAKIDKIAAEL